MTLILSMAAFALVASLSPGPVNLVGFNTGLTHGWRPALWHVAGATLGFVVLLLGVGLGLHEVLAAWPALLWILRVAGALFLLYLAWKLTRASGDLGSGAVAACPGFRDGALLQWLNPKAWLAAAAGVALFVGEDRGRLALFAGLYLVICFASLACWAVAGQWLRGRALTPGRLRLLNRALAALLVLCAASLLWEG
ncbi:MAG: LysE family translocator [Pseudomonas oryzihabitans]|uniref:Lysine transporter LysE n=1 Tax=Pseudomonas oryzihabitans TaxID=47885 RepID=A0ABX3IME6_9PSED|nr:MULTISPECIES: LysE family translocator [Pseudomonas]MBH3330230.1 LysE family translocator [Pseudomonas oryzihabitans]MCI1009548.1 LysE family translocator [Pseudomonas oryzihabitans]MDU4057737.1 LysE family translocator [Pseudomonas oryzihabitans]NMZ62893.1 LysE family translocator [Pseudomonas oryzihabitans]ONN69516.1 lysine transporter LysE [Pseudomonas psychrotolerans]